MNSIEKTDKIVILDMDETLVHTIEDQEYKILGDIKLFEDAKNQKYRNRVIVYKLEDILTSTGQGYDTHMWSILRPGLGDFLKFCCRYFKHVIIWSAGLEDYVVEVITTIFDPLSGICKPAKTWTRKKCESVKLTEDCEFGDKGDEIDSKPISKLAEKFPKLGISLKNTWIVDDRKDNFYCNPANGILIPAYRPTPTILGISRKDKRLKELTDWWNSEEVRNSTDVSTLDTTKIFK